MRSLMRKAFLIFAALIFPAGAMAQSSIEGRIRFEGPPPESRMLEVTRDHSVCGREKPDEAVLVLNGGLANVVVSIDGAPAAPAPPRDIVVANELCRFVPRITAATVGSNVIVQNRDAILHNTHAYLSDESTFFNVAFPLKGVQLRRPLAKPDIMRFECDAGHTWMKAFVHVFAHPFFAVSDAAGRFKIEGLPPGQYVLKAWHEKLGTQTRQIQIAAGVNRADFSFRP